MITVTIGGVDKTSSIVMGSLRKTDVLNQETDTLEFQVRKFGSSTYVPALGAEVIVQKDGSDIFGGVIVRVLENVEASTILEYTVTCNDYSQFLKRQLVTQRYQDTDVGTIIADLVANYTTDGFTTANVVGSQSIESVSFNRLSVADSLQKLADALSYVWYVDYDKDIHFFPRNTEHGPSLTDTSGNFIYNSLEITQDLTQIRNAVTVQGGEATSTSTRTEYQSGDGTRVQFPLSNKFSSLPNVLMNGAAVSVGVEYLDSDASFDCMWNYNEKYLRFTSGHIPSAGTNNISVTGYYLFPIVVKVPSPSSVALYGEYGFAITDTSIKSQNEAISRALAELQSYQNALYEGFFRTYTDGFRSGQVLNITSVQRARSIEVLVQSVRATMRDPQGNQLEYQVQFATLKSIGIIEYLQSQLRSKEVIVDDQETLLNYIPSTDAATTSDDIAGPTHTSGPYVWGTATWGYAVWS